MKILFICTSNICRSVMIEAICQKKLNKDKQLRKNIEIYSSGAFAQNGEEPISDVVEAMKEIRNRC